MANLTRGKYIICIDASFGGETPVWYKVGKRLSSLTVELNPDVTTEKNIFDETFATDNGYAPETSVDPYMANPDDEIYEKIRDIAMNRLVGDACRTKIMEILVEDEEETAHKAWTEYIIVKPTSVGGDTSGLSIPFNVYFDGGREEGTVTYANGNYKTGTPTFAPNSAA